MALGDALMREETVSRNRGYGVAFGNPADGTEFLLSKNHVVILSGGEAKTVSFPLFPEPESKDLVF